MQPDIPNELQRVDTGPMKHINFRVPDDLHAEVKALAEEDSRSLNAMLVVLVKEATAARKAAKTRSRKGVTK